MLSPPPAKPQLGPLPFLSPSSQRRLAELAALAPGLDLWPPLNAHDSSEASPDQAGQEGVPAPERLLSPVARPIYGTVRAIDAQTLWLEVPGEGVERVLLPVALEPDTRLKGAPEHPPQALLHVGDRVQVTAATAAPTSVKTNGGHNALQLRLLAPNLHAGPANPSSSATPSSSEEPRSPDLRSALEVRPCQETDQRPGGGASLAQLRARASLLSGIRRTFEQAGFLEVETPILALHAGLEPHLDPFESRFRPSLDAPGLPVWLLTSPEYCLKRLVAAGISKVFQLGKVFRNGEVGPNHNPEFTMLEWYRAWADYTSLMDDTEALICTLLEQQDHQNRLGQANPMGQAGARSLTADRLIWQGHTVHCQRPWRRLTVRDAFLQYAGLDLAAQLDSAASLRQAAQPLGLHLPPDASWDELYFRILIERIEPQLGLDRPTFLLDYPAQFAALSRVRPGAFPVAERFELYIAGVEVANAYSELNDPVKQALRFAMEQEERRALGAPVFAPDPDYLSMLETGLPPTAGIALGVDRLIMLLTGARSVRETLAFPFPME